MDKVKLPIAEIFESPQGEGHYTGVSMVFVRFAGCSVGRPYSSASREVLGLQIWQERCTAWDNVHFPCDTAYRMTERLTVDEILSRVGSSPRICITGGEPLMHDLTEFITEAKAKKKKIHIETSGTKSTDDLRESFPDIWITVSPKNGYIPEVLLDANEVKVLIGLEFDESRFLHEFGALMESGKLWIQPINMLTEVDSANLKKCMDLQQRYPKLKLSVQLHKYVGCR